jgi:hypothetical protein
MSIFLKYQSRITPRLVSSLTCIAILNAVLLLSYLYLD